jgi:uncharacterized membrane protein
MSDTVHPAPHRHKVNRLTFALCVCAAPALWMAQLVLAYVIWAYGCYPGDHPVVWTGAPTARTVNFVIDAIAILGTLVAFVWSYRLWHRVKEEMEGDHLALIDTGEGRTRFMAMWGMLFSGAFLIGIVFSTIASAVAPSCG